MCSEAIVPDFSKECLDKVNLAASDAEIGGNIMHGKVNEVSDDKDLDDRETELAESTDDSLTTSHRDTDDSFDFSTRASCQHELDSEVEQSEFDSGDRSPSKKHVKLIFLDMDGPIAPYERGRTHHKWNTGDDFADAPYALHVSELRRIIDMCGGRDVVKVVLSSNWRTDDEKMVWLKAQFERYGIDMIGHTDMIHMHPQTSPEMSRNVEIHRVLRYKTLGVDGPYFDQAAGTNKFRPWQLPPDWQITNWIAIDDLRLDRVHESQLNRAQYFVGYLPLEDAMPEARAPGWYQLSEGFASTIAEFHKEFAAKHFVYADPENGLANTMGAADDAITLLNAPSTTLGAADDVLNLI